MKLVTFESAAGRSRIGAVLGDDQAGLRVVDLQLAWALYLREVEADAVVPADMRALFAGGDASLAAARKALDYAQDYVVQLGAGGGRVTSPSGEALIYSLSDVKLKAPIIPKKFFHTAGNFREHHEEASKAGFSHPVMPWIVFFQNIDALIGPAQG